MEWIKVKVKHAEYDFMGADPEVFKAWILLMIFVAGAERVATEDELTSRMGLETFRRLKEYLKERGCSVEYVMDKVMEDVNHALNKRQHNKQYYNIRKTNSAGFQTSESKIKDGFTEGKNRIEEKRIYITHIEVLKHLVGVYGKLRGLTAENINNNYPRYAKASKALYIASGSKIDEAEAVLRRGAEYYTKKGLNWKLETIAKNYAEIKAGEVDPDDHIK